MKIFNFTPHAINLNDGSHFPPSGTVARVNATHQAVKIEGMDSVDIFHQKFGEIAGLPDQSPDRLYIVSAIVLAAAKAQGRGDCLAPATGHPDARRNDKGQIVSVPGLVC